MHVAVSVVVSYTTGTSSAHRDANPRPRARPQQNCKSNSQSKAKQMGHASSTAPIAGAPTTPMQLVEHLKYLLDHAQVNLDEFCDKHDIKALLDHVKMFQIYAQGIHDALPEPAAVDAAEANPEAMVNAAEKGDMAVVRKQLKAGVAVDAKVGEYEETALIAAAGGNQTKMSKFLVTRGADTNAKNKDGTTAMMKAAYNGNTELVGYLHEQGAEVNAQADSG